MTTDQRYSLHTGKPLIPGVDETVTEAARLGLEPPRFCAECGRRMVVQIRPDGWTSKCSRHGSNDSATSGRR